MKAMKIINGLKRRFKCQFDLVRFRVLHPNIPIINPLRIGTYYSQDGQDLYLSVLLFDWLKNHLGAYVVDVGCNHPERFSNSYFFEKYFKCNVIAIDPIEEFGELWKKFRPDATFIATALGKEESIVTLNIPEQHAVYDDMFSSVAGKNSKIGKTECLQRKVPCTTLASILNKYQLNEIAILSIDVEGFEVDVLQGIDFERALIRCLIIENNTKSFYGSEEIRTYLKSKDYIFYSRIGMLDDVFLHRSIADSLK